MNISLSVDCVDATLRNVPEVAEFGRLLAAVVPPHFTRSTLSYHTTFSCQSGRHRADVNSSDNKVSSCVSCSSIESFLRTTAAIIPYYPCRVHGGAWFALLNLPSAYSKNDGIRIQVGGKGTSKEDAIADAVFKTLQILLTLGPKRVHLPRSNFNGGDDAIARIRAAASSARLKLFEFLRDERLFFSFGEEMTPLLRLDPNGGWRLAIRNTSRALRETADEKKQRIDCVVAALIRYCNESQDGKFRPHQMSAAQREFLIANVVPYTLKSIVKNHGVFQLHQEEGFKWSVSVRILELLIARELETAMVTDITASVASGATSLQEKHQANNASRSDDVCVGGGKNLIFHSLDAGRDDEVVSVE